MSLPKKLLFAVWILVVALSLSAIVGEVVLRRWAAASPDAFVMGRSPARWRVRPGLNYYGFRLNSGGYHDLEFHRERTPGVKRVVALGDSFAFGAVPYAGNFLTLLEGELNAAGIPTEVYNLGVPALHTGDYLGLLEREGLSYQPDVVLVAVFLGNDLMERARTIRELSESYLVAWVKSLHQYFPKYWTALAGQGAYCDDCPSMTAEAYLALERTRGRICRTDFAPLPAWVALAAGDLQRMKARCDRQGVRLLVALLPDEVQTNPALRAEAFAEVDPALVDVMRPNRALTAALDAAGIPQRDLTPAFAAAGATERLYIPRDSHWDLRGNRLAAEALLPAVAATLQ
jgi:hypothetical protein